jgi:protease PrsW
MTLPPLLLASLCAGFLPMLAWGAVIWWLDRFEKEPLPLLALAFCWGVAPAAILALVSEFFVNIPLSHWLGHSLGFDLLSAGLTGPIVEELIKAAGIAGLFLIAGAEVDGPLDGIIYGAFVGLGFTATENVIFFLSTDSVPQWMWMVAQRALLFGLNHAVFAAIVGFGFAMASLARRPRDRLFWTGGGVVLAVLIHILFNLGLIFSDPLPVSFFASLVDLSVGFLLVAALFLLGLQHDQSAIHAHLATYVESGLLRREDFEAARTIHGRLIAEWRCLLRCRFAEYRQKAHLFNLMAELGLKEKRKSRFGSTEQLERRIARICVKIKVAQASGV